MQANKIFLYEVDNKTYEAHIFFKRVRNINYRFKDGKFVISCRRLTPMSMIKSGLDKFARTLIKKSSKKAPIGEDYIYILGEKVTLSFPGEYKFMDESFSYKNIEEFRKKIKKIFLKYLTYRTEYYAEEMNAPKYQVKIRDMKTRYGSNNRVKKTITYGFMLIHHPLCVRFQLHANPLLPFPIEMICFQAAPYTTLPVLRTSEMMDPLICLPASISSGVKAKISIGMDVTPIDFLTASVLS